MKGPNETDAPRCAACGGRLVLLIEINPHPQPHQQDHPKTMYFRCETCAHIQIVEE